MLPRYCGHHECKGNSASAALNKWLGPRGPKGCVVHSFRHSFRDLLRAVECPQDIADRLGGWSAVGVRLELERATEQVIRKMCYTSGLIELYQSRRTTSIKV